MDLFDLLVRLDVEGWRSHPPRDAVGGTQGAELQRLLRKVSAIEREGRLFDFRGIESPPEAPFQTDAPALCISVDDDQTVWLVHGERSTVVAARGPALFVLATSLPGFLQQLLEPVAEGESEAVPLGDIGFDGDGWGWAVPELPVPTELKGVQGPVHITAACAWFGDRVRQIEPVSSEPSEDTGGDGPDVGELFGGKGRPRPRTGLTALLLFSGVLTTLIGMACIAAPGGILVLLAWMVVEKDHDRVESGFLPEADRPTVERSRNLTHAGLLLVVALFFLQAMLLCFGAYDHLLDDVYIPLWRGFVTGLLGGPDPTPLP